jgi:hypothetical protein
MGRNAQHNVDAGWVRNHQSLKIHEPADRNSGNPPYEAMFMIGSGNTSDRCPAHWRGVSRGRFSETLVLVYGQRIGDAVEFLFDYPDRPLCTTFRSLPDKINGNGT